jgi:hypothetical protein
MTEVEPAKIKRPTRGLLKDAAGNLVPSKTVPGEWELEPLFVGEWETTRPTPMQAESDLLAAGAANLVMRKRWDLSPVDPSSFDPSEPPGRPVAPPSPPSNINPPTVTGTTVTGSVLTVTDGLWVDAATYARQWLRGATNRPGSTGTTITLTALDEGAMISCRVTATGPGGATPATSAAVGPITPTADDPGDGGGEGEVVQPTRRRRTS